MDSFAGTYTAAIAADQFEKAVTVGEEDVKCFHLAFNRLKVVVASVRKLLES